MTQITQHNNLVSLDCLGKQDGDVDDGVSACLYLRAKDGFYSAFTSDVSRFLAFMLS